MTVGVGGTGLRVLSCALGIFLFSMGWGKTGWLLDASPMVSELEGWREFAPAVSRWYLDLVAIPGAALFARLVLIGELAAGLALVVGYRIRLAASVALLMILNFHVAMGVIFESGYLTNGYGLPVVGGFAALAIGGTRLPFTFGERSFR